MTPTWANIRQHGPQHEPKWSKHGDKTGQLSASRGQHCPDKGQWNLKCRSRLAKRLFPSNMFWFNMANVVQNIPNYMEPMWPTCDQHRPTATTQPPQWPTLAGLGLAWPQHRPTQPQHRPTCPTAWVQHSSTWAQMAPTWMIEHCHLC